MAVGKNLQPLLRDCSPASGLSEEQLACRWLDAPEQEVAEDLAYFLADADALLAECALLFAGCADAQEGRRMPLPQLYVLTQRLIYCLGCRDHEVLARIAQVFSATVSGAARDGVIGPLEFQGHVAAVLTQILRELEARAAVVDAHPWCLPVAVSTAADLVHDAATQHGSDAPCVDGKVPAHKEVVVRPGTNLGTTGTSCLPAESGIDGTSRLDSPSTANPLIPPEVLALSTGTLSSWCGRVANTLLGRLDSAAAQLDAALAATAGMQSEGVFSTPCAAAASVVTHGGMEQAVAGLPYAVEVVGEAHTKFKVGDIVFAEGRRGKVTWDGRPRHQFVKLRWLEGPDVECALVPVSKIRQELRRELGRDSSLPPHGGEVPIWTLFRAAPDDGDAVYNSAQLFATDMPSPKRLDSSIHVNSEQEGAWPPYAGVNPVPIDRLAPHSVHHSGILDVNGVPRAGISIRSEGVTALSVGDTACFNNAGSRAAWQSPPHLTALPNSVIRPTHISPAEVVARPQGATDAAEAEHLLRTEGLSAYAAMCDGWVPKRLLVGAGDRYLYVADEAVGSLDTARLVAESPCFALCDLLQVTRRSAPSRHVLSLHFESGALVLRFSYPAMREALLAVLLASGRRLPVVEAAA